MYDCIIIGSSVAVVIISVSFFYYWIVKKGIRPANAFVAALFFLTSSSFIFHSHKQVLFLQYMPFLILALIGVDRFYKKARRGLLTIAIFFMFASNY